jgi:hypothetical protein
MDHSDRGSQESHRIFSRSYLWPGDALELQWDGGWVAATYQIDEGHHIIVFQIDRRTLGLTEVDQAFEWGLRPVLH